MLFNIVGEQFQLGGLVFEWRERRGAALGLSALLAWVVLGISMASLFDPAIGLLVPVLADVTDRRGDP